MLGEKVYQVCQKPHKKGRPFDLKFELAARRGMEFISPDEVLRQDHIQDQMLDNYKKDLSIIIE